MNQTATSLLIGLCLTIPAVSQSQGIFGGIIKNDEKKLDAEALTTQEGAANAKLQKAQSQEASGKTRQARDGYKTIVKSYRRTDAAAEAQYRYAKILEAEGDPKKAFEQYQELLTRHRNTPNFNQAISSQFQIADRLRGSDKKGFLGLGAAVQPSKLVEMFEQIAGNAPTPNLLPSPCSTLVTCTPSKAKTTKRSRLSSRSLILIRVPNMPPRRNTRFSG